MRIKKFLAVLLLVNFFACEQDNDEILQDDLNDISNSIEFYEVDYGDVTVTNPETIDLIKGLEIDEGSIKTKMMNFPDGTSEERIIVGGDLAFTMDQLKEMAGIGLPIDDVISQYRTTNLVRGTNRTIDILGFTGQNQGLSRRGQDGLRLAVDNFNRLRGVSLNFRLTFGSRQSQIDNADIVVFDDSINESSSGGVAGFPDSQGRPNKFIAIFNIDGFSTNVNEHVITHEIGHSIGLRHTDWFNRISCGGSPVFEGRGSIGAIHISGTPIGNDSSSLMNACFSASVNGEFNSNDVRALQNIY